MDLFKEIVQDALEKIGIETKPKSFIDPVTISIITQIVFTVLPLVISLGKELIPIIIKYIPQIIAIINKTKGGNELACSWGKKISDVTKSFIPKIVDEFKKSHH